jgi:uncharacterized protein DUF4760
MTTDEARLLVEGLTALGALVAASQVYFVRGQLKDTRQWNRMTFALDYLARRERIADIELLLNNSFVRLIDRTEPLSAEEVARLFTDAEHETRFALSRFLNALETYCAAVNSGIADEEVASHLYKHKFQRHYTELRPYIEHVRTLRNAPTLLWELEALVTKWGSRPVPKPRYP